MHRKLALDTDARRVESFGTARGDSGRGAVRAHGYTGPGYPGCARTCGVSPPAPTAFCNRAMIPSIACCY